MKQSIGIICILAFLGQLFVGSMNLQHSDDCHTLIHSESDSGHDQPGLDTCCGGCEHGENTSEESSVEADFGHHVGNHKPHCNCHPPNYQSAPVAETKPKEQRLEINKLTDKVQGPRPCSYLAAAPSIGPPRHIDVGWHSSGKYVATHFCIWTV